MEKRSIKIMLSVILAIIFVGSITVFALYSTNVIQNNDNKTQIVDMKDAFIGTIVAINGNTATINVTSGDVLKSADKINIDLKDNTFEKGDKVKVTYKGYIMETYPAKVDMETIQKVETSKVVKLYTTLIDDIVTQDSGLNGGMQYIAIDINSFTTFIEEELKQGQIQSLMYPKMSEEDKTDIINYLYKYHDNIKVASYNDLKEQGLVIEGEDVIPHIDGILIYVTKLEKKSDDNYIVSMVKYRSGLGAIFPEYNAKYKDNKWTFEITSMAIS